MTPDWNPLGRGLVVVGAILLGTGVLLLVAPKIPWVGRLPGDLLVQKGRFTLYMPLTTCLLVSVVVTLLLWVIGRFRS